MLGWGTYFAVWNLAVFVTCLPLYTILDLARGGISILRGCSTLWRDLAQTTCSRMRADVSIKDGVLTTLEMALVTLVEVFLS